MKNATITDNISNKGKQSSKCLEYSAVHQSNTNDSFGATFKMDTINYSRNNSLLTPSLISLMVSVDVKRPVYLLICLLVIKSSKSLRFLQQDSTRATVSTACNDKQGDPFCSLDQHGNLHEPHLTQAKKWIEDL